MIDCSRCVPLVVQRKSNTEKWRCTNKMHDTVQVLAQVMPSRWAFEGLLLLEADRRPTWVVPSAGGTHVAASLRDAHPVSERPDHVGAVPEPEPPELHDMAENYFPADSQRMGVRASWFALSSILICLVAAIHAILRSRDIH